MGLNLSFHRVKSIKFDKTERFCDGVAGENNDKKFSARIMFIVFEDGTSERIGFFADESEHLIIDD